MTTVDTYLAGLSAEHVEIANILRARLTEGLPGAEEQLWHGHPVWMKGKDPIVGFKAYPRWVTLLFWHPAKINDPTGVLSSSAGGSVLMLKVQDAGSLDITQVDRWLSELADEL